MSKDAAEAASLEAIGYCLGQAPDRGIVYSRLKGDWASPVLSEGEIKLRDFCKKNGYGFHLLQLDPQTDYREGDCIHLNENGQRKLAGLLVRLLSDGHRRD